jgi:hypothetical protein
VRRGVYIVRRGATFLVRKTPVVGWHWQTTGCAWVSAPRYATKFRRRGLARLAAREYGGQAERACIRSPRAGALRRSVGRPLLNLAQELQVRRHVLSSRVVKRRLKCAKYFETARNPATQKRPGLGQH